MTESGSAPPGLEEIGALCRHYARARARLAETGAEIRALQREALRGRLRRLRSRAAACEDARAELAAAVAAAPGLFARPRTRIVEGVRVGYRRRPGRVACADEAAAIADIRRLFPDRAAELIRIAESLDRNAVRRLDAETQAAIGVVVAESGDEILVAAAPDDLDRLVAGLLEDGDAA